MVVPALAPASQLAAAVGAGLFAMAAPARGFEPATLASAARSAPDGTLWLLAVGVSKYAHADARTLLDLAYADRDAQAFAEVMKSSPLRSVREKKVRLLLNDRATAREVRGALREWLRPAPADTVVVYFAGHGQVENEELYLLPHDTEPDHIPSTALRMAEVAEALASNAARVLLFTDACHAAGVRLSPGATRPLAKPLPVNAGTRIYLKDRNRVSFSAAEDDELSAESADWGGGHGAFTWYLMQGLRGAADLDRNGRVDLRELMYFTSSAVEGASGGRQHPRLSGDIALGMSLADVEQAVASR
jgi:uncharacterized caspase-like protein